MICPACKKPMIVVEYHRIELDYCGNCQGLWFDNGELELLLAQAKIDSTQPLLKGVLQIEEAASNEKRRKCPICRRTMRKVNVTSDKHVLIDACVQHDGLWFDGGEVDHLIKYMAGQSPAQPGHGEVFNFIKEVFQIKS
jgi:uncharacterized protein